MNPQTRATMRMCRTLAGLLLMLWALAVNAQPGAGPADGSKTVVPAQIFVDDDNAGAQDGTILRPFRTVQQAIKSAKSNDVIAVAGGVYPGNISVQEKVVRLYGGYVGGNKAGYAGGTPGNFKERDPAVNPSQLKGNGKDSVVTLVEAGATVVDGFVVSGGGYSALDKPHRRGGGFYVSQGTPTISHNVIEKNQTCRPVKQDEENFGGGIYASGANITILNNVIRNNVSGRGAGVALDVPKAVIRGNLVEKNIGVSDHGGGLYIHSANAEISHNRIIGNEIGRDVGYGWGGGVLVYGGEGKYKLSHNVYTGNFAPTLGSAFFVDEGGHATMDHDLFYANLDNPKGDRYVTPINVDGDGGKFFSTLVMNHVTITDHPVKPDFPGHAITVEDKSKLIVKNSILWNNGGGDIVLVEKAAKATVTYTLTQKPFKGTGNLSKDPQFVNPAGRDYRLRPSSPAIDAADPAAPFNLEPAPNGGRADLGVYGNSAQAGAGKGELVVKEEGGKEVEPKEKEPAEIKSKTYLLRAGELPSEVGDDNTKLTKITSKQLGGMAVQIELIDTFGQKKSAIEDWTPFGNLRMDIVNESEKNLDVVLNLFHSGTNNVATRVFAPFVLKPGKNEVRIAVKDLKNSNGSAANLAEVRRWYVASETPATLHLGDIFLEGGTGKEDAAKDDGGVKEKGSDEKTAKTYLLRAGELPSETGDDATKMTKVTSKELGGAAVEIELIDTFGQSKSRIEDWTPFHTLRMDIVNQGEKRLQVTLNLFHSGTNNVATRVFAPFDLKPGKNEVRIAVKDLKNSNGSAAKLAEVKRWYVASETPATLHLGDIFLEGNAGSKAGNAGTYRIKTDPARLARIKAATMPKFAKPVPYNTPEADAIMSAAEIFPPDNPWNTLVEDWPLHPNSKNIVASIGADKFLRYNQDMAFVIVPPGQKMIDVKLLEHKNESDPGPYPVPDNTPIEGWPASFQQDPKLKKLTLDDVQRGKPSLDEDRHGIVFDPANRKLYEFYRLTKSDKGWHADQASIFDLASNKLRPDSWTSSDAAGLPILPAIVRYDEIQRGVIDHALRFTVRRSRRAYVYPATHFASQLTDENLPRMGERFRLRKDFDTSKFSPEVRVILEALKRYGMFMADNGMDWGLSVSADHRLPVLHEELRRIKGSDFEVVTPPPGYVAP